MADAPAPAPLGALKSRISSPRAAPAPEPTRGSTKRFDHSLLSALVSRASDGWSVDYDEIARSPELPEYLENLGGADPDSLGRDEAAAFWINAYNACILELVVRWRPKRSINDIPGAFWGERFRIAGVALSADGIEHAKARKFGDALVHFGLNCASRGCPPLAVYSGAAVWQELEANGRRYLADESRGASLAGPRKIRLSQIFRWFGGDFAPITKPPSELGTLLALFRPKRLLPWTLPYLPEQLRGATEVGFLKYDWSLNSA